MPVSELEVFRSVFDKCVNRIILIVLEVVEIQLWTLQVIFIVNFTCIKSKFEVCYVSQILKKIIKY